jgi:hypothetical protein
MSSENGLSTKKWGPGAWVLLHSSAQRYPKNPTEEEKKCYKSFYTNVKYTLPCGKCKKSYTEFLKMLPIDYFLGSRDLLIFWIYTIHNFVNFKLRGQGNKIGDIPTLEEVYRKYEKYSQF